MPKTLSPEDTREVVLAHNAELKRLPTFKEPTQDEYLLFSKYQSLAQSQAHKLSRGKRQVSVDLGLVMDDFEELFKGKSVLDIGCGLGYLSSELARLKKTKVTALDHDPEVLDKIKTSSNLKVVEGSGYEVAGAVGDEKFDTIISSFSSYYWAGNEDERRASILSPLANCAVGGKLIIVPVIAEPGIRAANREPVQRGLDRATEKGDTQEIERLSMYRAGIVVSDWLDIIGIDTLLESEANDVLACTFLSSRDNAKQIRMPGSNAFLERYSVIADVVSQEA